MCLMTNIKDKPYKARGQLNSTWTQIQGFWIRILVLILEFVCVGVPNYHSVDAPTLSGFTEPANEHWNEKTEKSGSLKSPSEY